MKKSLFIVLAFALLSSGCSTITLVYRNADWYLQYKITGYTSFNPQQKKTIRENVSAYMDWHRKSALPEYIIFLQNLNGAAQYDGQLSTAKITQLRTHLADLYKKTMAPAIMPSAEILSGLDKQQIQELDRNFAKENKKLKHEELDVSRDEYLDSRADKIISFIEWLVGSLNNDQEKTIREMTRRLPVVNDIYMMQRESNQGKLITLLNEQADKEKIAAFLSSWILTPEAGRTPQHQRAILAYEQATDEMIARIHGMLTDKQKDHIHQVISSLIDDMRSEIRKAQQRPKGTSD